MLSLFYDCTIERNYSAVDKSCCSDGVVYSIAFNSSKADEVLTPRYADITAETFASRTADADLTALSRDGAASDGDITAGTFVSRTADSDLTALSRDGAASDGDITAGGISPASDAYMAILECEVAALNLDVATGNGRKAADACRGRAFSRKFAIARDDEL